MGSGSSSASRISLHSTAATSSQNSKNLKDEVNSSAQQKQKPRSSIQLTPSKEVMISYSHADKEVMKKVREGLEASGITVWVDMTGLQAGVDFLSKIGQAIIDAKMVVSLLSVSTCKSRYCQDELALAYVSNKAIFPVGLQPPEELFPTMTTGMKLQLAKCEWTLFLKKEDFEKNLDELIGKMKEFIKNSERSEEKPQMSPSNKEIDLSNTRSSVNQKVLKRSLSGKLTSVTEAIQSLEETDFWQLHFGNRNSVTWEDFEKAFTTQYNKALRQVFSESDKEWLMGILRREMNVDESEVVFKKNYTEFCTIDNEYQSFWSRLQDQAVESYTMKEVFNMESSVRVEAIENLGKFHSPAVIEALLDLLTDKDNNVRAVAAISLARTGATGPNVDKALMKCLNEKDRLVRESACLALGHLKVKAAVPKLVHLWRNDFISHVREAAQIALEQIGGEEANKAMHITRVLSEEIRTLTASN